MQCLMINACALTNVHPVSNNSYVPTHLIELHVLPTLLFTRYCLHNTYTLHEWFVGNHKQVLDS